MSNVGAMLNKMNITQAEHRSDILPAYTSKADRYVQALGLTEDSFLGKD